MAGEITPGGAMLYLREKFHGYFMERDKFVTVGPGAVSVVGNNPDRLALVLINAAAIDVSISLRNGFGFPQGIHIGASGGSCIMTIDEDLTLVTREWWGKTTATGGQLLVIELLREIEEDSLHS